MKRVVAFALCAFACAGGALGSPDYIGIFSDASASSYNFVDEGSLVTVYVWHLYSQGTTASEWMLDVSQTGWTHLGDTPDFFLVIGTSVDGVSVAYELCLYGDFKLMTVNFLGSSAPACTYIGIVAAPGRQGVQAIDCSEGRVFPRGGQGIVNSDGICDLPPVEGTTWSRIKALYR